MNPIKKSIPYGRHTLTLETGEIARQAGGAVMASLDDTVVLVSAVARKEAKAGQDFFPLTVDYQEKTFAAGKIPGGFFRREGRPSEKETLTSRLIDRPIRPLFPDGFYNEVQVIATVLSVDPEIDPDIPAMIGASAALMLSGVPFNGPIGAARVGYVDGQYVLNPTKTELTTSALNLVVAGTEAAVLMVESEADELPEEVMLGAVVYGHQQQQAAIELIHSLVEESGKPLWDWQPPAKDEAMIAKVTAMADAALHEAYQLRSKQARQQRLKDIYARVGSECVPADAAPGYTNQVNNFVFELEAKIVREPDPVGRAAHRRSRHAHGASDHDQDRRAAAHARLGALHPRRDAGDRRRDARNRARRADHRRADGRVPRPLHVPLQHAAVRDRRNGARRFAQAPRDRSWPARQARVARRVADGRGVRLLDARRVRNHRVERQLVDGVGLRREPRADGRGRSDEGARRRHRDGPHQGRQPLCRPDRHPG